MRLFCDRCGEEVSDIPSSAISGVFNADRDGNGTVTEAFDHICNDCYEAFRAFMAAKPEGAKAEGR